MKKNFMVYLEIEPYLEFQQKFPRTASTRLNELIADELERLEKEKKKPIDTLKRNTPTEDFAIKQRANALSHEEMGLASEINPKSLTAEQQKEYNSRFTNHFVRLKKEAEKK